MYSEFGIQHFIVIFSGDANRFFPPENSTLSLEVFQCLIAQDLFICFSIQMNFIIHVASQRFSRRILICSKLDSNCCFWSIIRLFCACLHFGFFLCLFLHFSLPERCATLRMIMTKTFSYSIYILHGIASPCKLLEHRTLDEILKIYFWTCKSVCPFISIVCVRAFDISWIFIRHVSIVSHE